MVLYTMKESSVDVGQTFGDTIYNKGTVVASDWHDSTKDERVILTLRGYRHYSVRIVKQASPNDISTWEVLYEETFHSIESAVSGEMEHVGYGAYGPKEAAPWRAGYRDCKER